MQSNKEITPLYNENGSLQGVYISANKWFEKEAELEALLFSKESAHSETKKSVLRAEPTKDWELFLSYWDFNYPVEKVVKCENCGAHTENWTEDEPKKFRLKAANIGGMVSFLCVKCKYRVTKKHFKDHICYECRPFTCKIR